MFREVPVNRLCLFCYSNLFYVHDQLQVAICVDHLRVIDLGGIIICPFQLKQAVTISTVLYCLWCVKSLLYVKPHNTTLFGKHDFSLAGPVAWNSLSSHFCCITDTVIFKCKIKTKFLNMCLSTDIWHFIGIPGTLHVTALFNCCLYISIIYSNWFAIVLQVC